jgi:dolichol-phosphate mannosyltransferase
VATLPVVSTRVRARIGVAPVALVVSTVALVAILLADTRLSNELYVALVLVACAGFVVMLVAEHRRPVLTIKLVGAVIAAQTVASLLVMPRATGDLWWYAIYGRMVAAHGTSPYSHTPALFPHDPLLAFAGRGWSHVPSVYGPFFTGLSALASFPLGTATIPTRLFYQGLAAAALVAACVLVWRRTRSATAVAFLAANPVMALYVVNGGRNDILVGVAVLAAVLLAARGHDTTAGAVGGLAVLVKLTGAVGLVALVAATAVGRGRRAAVRIAGAATVLVVAGYALAGGTVALLTPFRTAGARFSRSSMWRVLPKVFTVGAPSTHVVLVVLALLVVAVIARSARAGASTSVTAAVTVLCAGAAYTLPGYAAWAAPTAALDHRSRISRLAAASGVILVVIYEILRHPFDGWVGHCVSLVATVGGPLALLVVVVMTVRAAGRRESDADPAERPPVRAIRPSSDLDALVVVPTRDEAENIETVLRATRAAVPQAHVLVVDDASLDGTPELAEAVGAELGGIDVVRRVGAGGLGSAYRTGFAMGMVAGFDVIVEMDADRSHDPASLPMLLDTIAAGADLAIGSRYVPGGATPGWSWSRRGLSRGGNTFARLMLRLTVHDATSGFRAYRTDVLRAVDLETVEANGYGFQIEMTHRVARAGGTVVEVPIVFRDRVAGTSKMSTAIVVEALALVTRWGVRDRCRRLPSLRTLSPALPPVRQGGGDPTPEAA